MLTHFSWEDMFQRGSSFIFLFRNRETEPWKLIKISSLIWEGKTNSKNFSREKWIGVRDSCLSQSPTASSISLSRKIPSQGNFTWPKLFFWEAKLPNGSILLFLHWIFCFFPKKQRNKRSKGRSHVKIQSIHPSCHPCAIKLSHISRGDTRAI